MPPAERAVRLIRWLELLNDRPEPVSIRELVAIAQREFGVSEVTLRADLATLSGWQPVGRVGRGAFGRLGGNVAADDPGSLFATRLRLNADAKAAIAAAVVADLRSDPALRVLLLDAGTTPFYLADPLAETPGLDLIVWTPNVPAAMRLAVHPGISVRLLGGEVCLRFAAVAGDETVRSLLQLAGRSPEAGFDALPIFPDAHCVLAINALDEQGRLLTDESVERLQKRLMARLADTVTIVADADKLFAPRLGLAAHEVLSLPELAGRRRIRLVTDRRATEATRAACERWFQQAFRGYVVTGHLVGDAVVFEARRPDD